MKSSQLTIRQATILQDNIGHFYQYLTRLKSRMEALQFPVDDQLFRDVREAHEVISKLWIGLHYLSCESGVGRDSSSEQK